MNTISFDVLIEDFGQPINWNLSQSCILYRAGRRNGHNVTLVGVSDIQDGKYSVFIDEDMYYFVDETGNKIASMYDNRDTHHLVPDMLPATVTITFVRLVEEG